MAALTWKDLRTHCEEFKNGEVRVDQALIKAKTTPDLEELKSTIRNVFHMNTILQKLPARAHYQQNTNSRGNKTLTIIN